MQMKSTKKTTRIIKKYEKSKLLRQYQVTESKFCSMAGWSLREYCNSQPVKWSDYRYYDSYKPSDVM